MINKFNKIEEKHSELAKKINEVIDWVNKQDEHNKRYEKLIERVMKMKEEEHKKAMELAELSKTMVKDLKKIS